MTATVVGIHLGPDTHANRPAATAVESGTLYSCSDHSLVYISDGASWTTWADMTGTGGTVPVPWALVPESGAHFGATQAMGATNRAIYVPALLVADATITGIKLRVGTSNGNICVGLYDSAGNRVATSGSVACPSSGLATVALTSSYAAAAGRYYLALSASSATATFVVPHAGTQTGPASARYEEAAHPLPATATFAGEVFPLSLLGVISGGYPA